MKKLIEITSEEVAAILVGMTEFEDRIHSAKSGCFDCYKDLTPQIREKFRKLAWEFHAQSAFKKE